MVCRSGDSLNTLLAELEEIEAALADDYQVIEPVLEP